MTENLPLLVSAVDVVVVVDGDSGDHSQSLGALYSVELFTENTVHQFASNSNNNHDQHGHRCDRLDQVDTGRSFVWLLDMHIRCSCSWWW